MLGMKEDTWCWSTGSAPWKLCGRIKYDSGQKELVISMKDLMTQNWVKVVFEFLHYKLEYFVSGKMEEII